MFKSLFVLTLTFFIYSYSFAQRAKHGLAKHDSSAYYMRDRFDLAYNKEDAKFLRLIIKGDSGLFEIQDYYLDGKLHFLAYSYNQTINFELGADGKYVEYYPTGTKKLERSYIKGNLVGETNAYYPNGKLYYVKTIKMDSIYLTTCYDTTGKILSDKGNGFWINYLDDNFKIKLEGPVVNGRENGIWKLNHIRDTAYSEITFKDGKVISGSEFLTGQSQSVFRLDKQPGFPGGQSGFGEYLKHTLRYPQYAREHNIQGKVILTFTVEKDGRLTGILIKSSPDKSLSEEAVRVMENSPLWIPAIQDGRAIRIQYSVPLNFALANEN